MTNQPDLDVETRLREDAQRMLDRQPAISVQELLTRHRRRVFQRRLTRGVVIAGILTCAFIRFGSDDLGRMANTPPLAPAVQNANQPSSSLPAPVTLENPPPSPDDNAPSLAVPLALVGHRADGTQIVLPAFFIHQPARPIDPQTLTPVERRAIRKVLGLKPPVSDQSIW